MDNFSKYMNPPEEVKEPKEVTETAKETVGVVNDSCTALNVRKEPSLEAEIICSINSGSKLVVDEAGSTDEWVKVCTETGAEGFCMKEYVTVE